MATTATVVIAIGMTEEIGTETGTEKGTGIATAIGSVIAAESGAGTNEAAAGIGSTGAIGNAAEAEVAAASATRVVEASFRNGGGVYYLTDNILTKDSKIEIIYCSAQKQKK